MAVGTAQHALFATGLGAPEGPVALPGGAMYVTEMAGDRLRVTKLTPNGTQDVVIATGGRPNGLAVDGDGNLWIAEAGHRAVVCCTPEGRELLRIDAASDGPFRFPNDLAFGPDGLLYVTDSGLPLTQFLDGQEFAPDYLAMPWDGCIYVIDPRAGRTLRRIDAGIRFTNGIAFDGADRLYANASFTGDVYRYDVFGTSEPKRELFGNVLLPDDSEDFFGPDGMKFGTDGRLYCTVYGQRNITVLDTSGEPVDRLPLHGGNPTNCAFALEGHTLLVTEVHHGQVEAVAVPCNGLALHKPTLGHG